MLKNAERKIGVRYATYHEVFSTLLKNTTPFSNALIFF